MVKVYHLTEFKLQNGSAKTPEEKEQMLQQLRAHILEEIQALDDVKSASYVEDNTALRIETKDDAFSSVMDRVYNICAHEADSEVSFERFDYED